jgi:nucleotide-binding universal stress UspA family protein
MIRFGGDMAGRLEMKHVLLHGGSDERFDHAVWFARQFVEAFGARLHLVYTVAEPLSAGWTAEMSASRLPELHQAMEAEARERLGRLFPEDEQDRFGIEIVVLTGLPSDEIVRYVSEHHVDVAIVQADPSSGAGGHVAQALLDESQCAVIVLR